MNEITRLLGYAAELGLRFERRGDKLAVIPAKLCPPEFAEALRPHKREILDLIEARAHNLPSDCAPWLHIAKQVLAGEFDGADGSTRDSLTIGLRSIKNPVCGSAIKHLWPEGMPKHLQPR